MKSATSMTDPWQPLSQSPLLFQVMMRVILVLFSALNVINVNDVVSLMSSSYVCSAVGVVACYCCDFRHKWTFRCRWIVFFLWCHCIFSDPVHVPWSLFPFFDYSKVLFAKHSGVKLISLELLNISFRHLNDLTMHRFWNNFWVYVL